MHLGIVRAEELAPPASADLDAMILDALEHAGPDGLERASLRAAVRVRNERVGEALTRLAAAGHRVRRGDCWVRVPLPTPDTHRNGNGNSSAVPAGTDFCDRQEIPDQSGLRGQAPRDPSRIPPAGLQAARASEGGSKCRGVRGAEPHDACSLSSRHQTATIPSMQCGPVQYVSCAKAIERNWSRQEKFCTL